MHVHAHSAHAIFNGDLMMSQRKEFWTYSKSRSVRISQQIEPKMGENEDLGMTVLLLA